MLLVVLVVCPLSYGPAVWLNQRIQIENSTNMVQAVFAPMERLHLLSPDWIRRINDRYYTWWAGNSLSLTIADRELIREFLRENP